MTLEARVRDYVERCRGTSVYRDEPDPVTAQIDGLTNSEFLELLSTVLEDAENGRQNSSKMREL